MFRKCLMISAAVLALAGCDMTNGGGSQSGGGSEESGSVDRSGQEQLKAALNGAPKHGLSKDLFFKGDIGAAEAGELREAVLSYASALANGKVDPNEVHDVYTLPRPKVDVKAAFDQALQQNRLGEWLDSLAPQTAEYKALSNAFVQLAGSVSDLRGESIPATGKVIKVGESDPRVPAIAQNLRAQGYLAASGGGTPTEAKGAEKPQASQPEEQAGASNLFTPELSNALKQWQADAGLKADGVVGPNTVQQLNDGPKDRARKLAIAMERLRWLEREAPATRIDVNTAASFLEYFRDGKKIDQRRVVVGEPGWETPQLSAPIFALVANPNWVVPQSIVKEDIEGKSSQWLEQNNFSKKNGQWVQEPGPESALGLVKFAMENDHAIYLHDTPHKGLFGQENRHESHGCVRVENAVQFARAMAQQEGVADQFNRAMGKNEEKQIQLPDKIPVRLMYHTAYVGGDGRVRYAEDVYGWDNEVAIALGYEKKEVDRGAGKRRAGDIGP